MADSFGRLGGCWLFFRRFPPPLSYSGALVLSVLHYATALVIRARSQPRRWARRIRLQRVNISEMADGEAATFRPFAKISVVWKNRGKTNTPTGAEERRRREVGPSHACEIPDSDQNNSAAGERKRQVPAQYGQPTPQMLAGWRAAKQVT